MRTGSWSSFQSALPPEARAGGEPDDPGPPPRTIPEKIEPGKRFLEQNGLAWDVYDWLDEGCDCLGRTTTEEGEPCSDPACPACDGTGRGVPVPDLVAARLTEADARLLAFGVLPPAGPPAAPDLRDHFAAHAPPVPDWFDHRPAPGRPHPPIMPESVAGPRPKPRDPDWEARDRAWRDRVNELHRQQIPARRRYEAALSAWRQADWLARLAQWAYAYADAVLAARGGPPA